MLLTINHLSQDLTATPASQSGGLPADVVTEVRTRATSNLCGTSLLEAEPNGSGECVNEVLGVSGIAGVTPSMLYSSHLDT